MMISKWTHLLNGSCNLYGDLCRNSFVSSFSPGPFWEYNLIMSCGTERKVYIGVLNVLTISFTCSQDIVTWGGGAYFLEDGTPVPPDKLDESKIAFTKNGAWQGIAYE